MKFLTHTLEFRKTEFNDILGLLHFQDQIKQFMDIDVGLKMNSYTVNNLEPGVEYLFELCLRKENYIIPISSTLLTTRNSGYEVALGIETDYVTLGAVTLILTTLVISCFALSLLRW